MPGTANAGRTSPKRKPSLALAGHSCVFTRLKARAVGGGKIGCKFARS
jgi:hypothetical protein